jgi:glycosyltransferase involved in cell wall biosynthesis
LCLNSILNQIKEDHTIEIIVIDNNSNDKTKEYICNIRSSYINYYLETKQGLSHARNKGIKVSKGEFLAFVDDDAVIDDKWLISLLLQLEKKQKNHIYGGPIFPNFEVECPKWIDRNYFVREFKSSDGYLDKLTAQDGFSGGNMCIPKGIFDNIGNFNTNLGMQGKKMGLGEESELFFRIHNQIKVVKLYNIKNMSITHFEAKFKLDKKYLKDRITLSSIQFTNRLLSENTLKSKIMIYGKLLKQSIDLNFNFILSLFITRRKFHYLKNYWVISGILKSIIK